MAMMFQRAAPIIASAALLQSTAVDAELMITGVIDNGRAKAVELYEYAFTSYPPDYGISSENNGDGTDGREFNLTQEQFPGGVCTGTYITIASNSTEFGIIFCFEPDYEAFQALHNIDGDDAIELFFDNNVVDRFGEPNVAGYSQPWYYKDRWAHRKVSLMPNGGLFDIREWTISEPNGTTPFPFNAYDVSVWK